MDRLADVSMGGKRWIAVKLMCPRLPPPHHQELHLDMQWTHDQVKRAVARIVGIPLAQLHLTRVDVVRFCHGHALAACQRLTLPGLLLRVRMCAAMYRNSDV